MLNLNILIALCTTKWLIFQNLVTNFCIEQSDPVLPFYITAASQDYYACDLDYALLFQVIQILFVIYVNHCHYIPDIGGVSTAEFDSPFSGKAPESTYPSFLPLLTI